MRASLPNSRSTHSFCSTWASHGENELHPTVSVLVVTTKRPSRERQRHVIWSTLALATGVGSLVVYRSPKTISAPGSTGTVPIRSHLLSTISQPRAGDHHKCTAHLLGCQPCMMNGGKRKTQAWHCSTLQPPVQSLPFLDHGPVHGMSGNLLVVGGSCFVGSPRWHGD